MVSAQFPQLLAVPTTYCSTHLESATFPRLLFEGKGCVKRLQCSRFRYQDTHNQSYIMVMASGRWLGVRLDLLSSVLTGAVALTAVFMSQDAGLKTFTDLLIII